MTIEVSKFEARSPGDLTFGAIDHAPLVAILDTAVASLNMGDHIIMDSVRARLSETMPATVFATMPTHDYLGVASYDILARAEYSIVGGTNLLASTMDTYKQWKVAGNELLKLRDVVLCGVGWWQYQEDPNPYTVDLLQTVLHKTKLHSVRDGYTASKLKAAGIENVLNTACVTMWGLTPEHMADVPAGKGENVLLTFTDYKPDPAADTALYKYLKSQYENVYFWLQGSSDYQYAKKILDDDVKIVGPTLGALDAALAGVPDLDYVGTRLHAGVRALQHKRRTTIVAVDNRAAEISSDTQLPVIPRGDLDAVEQAVDGETPIRLTLPWDNIQTWLSQFGEAKQNG